MLISNQSDLLKLGIERINEAFYGWDLPGSFDSRFEKLSTLDFRKLMAVHMIEDDSWQRQDNATVKTKINDWLTTTDKELEDIFDEINYEIEYWFECHLYDFTRDQFDASSLREKIIEVIESHLLLD